MHWLALPLPPENPPCQLPQAAPQWQQVHPGALVDQLVDTRSARAWWALRFTPLVAQVDDVLAMEISGSERLFGGRAQLEQRIFDANMPLAGIAYAQGATSLVAVGRLIHGREVAPGALPVQVLAAARPHLATLERLGVRTWGQLDALPRGGLVRRFGTQLVDALDRAYGRAPEVYPWLCLPEVFDAPLELVASVDSAQGLLFGARRLLAQLLVWLRARQRGVLALELLWTLDARRANSRHIDAHHDGGHTGRMVLRTAQATQDMTHLQRLLAEQLARVTLPAPVLHLRLRSVQTQAMSGESHSLLPEEQRTGDSLHQTLERLAARLGPQRVRRVELLADHAPERMQRWAPNEDAVAKPQQKKTGLPLCPDARLLPGWLLPEPLSLREQDQQPHYLGALQLLAGPQRLEGGWLDGNAVLRDYYIARSPGAGLVWIYADRAGSGWFLHGVYG